MAVVGIAYGNNAKSKGDRRYEMLLGKPGDPIELRPELKNKHDKNAVAVFTQRSTQLGYLTAERVPWIGGKIAAGEEYIAVFQEPGVTSAVIRVRFGGGAPTLPPPRSKPARSIGDDFYADPDGSEWGA